MPTYRVPCIIFPAEEVKDKQSPDIIMDLKYPINPSKSNNIPQGSDYFPANV